ncbi:MAG TPA: dihydroneopterin aldolase [Paracoccaceae bacterium]|nr:dihydroneopterin aldolase [Paracoccaceae bacterium]
MSKRDSSLPHDRVFLANYLRELEIGVLDSEYDVTQRLRFDIALEVEPAAEPIGDDPDRVISYVTLIDAIDQVANGPRLKLVESFAERLAEITLADPRARRVHIRIEKLDHLEHGAVFGIEIVRGRSEQITERP